jgi:hypothetical protein
MTKKTGTPVGLASVFAYIETFVTETKPGLYRGAVAGRGGPLNRSSI